MKRIVSVLGCRGKEGAKSIKLKKGKKYKQDLKIQEDEFMVYS